MGSERRGIAFRGELEKNARKDNRVRNEELYGQKDFSKLEENESKGESVSKRKNLLIKYPFNTISGGARDGP